MELDAEGERYPADEVAKRLQVIEDQELDSPRGQLSEELYAEFLGLYLLAKDVISAKFLWQRIPSDLKSPDNELKATWEVGKAAWNHNYAGIHTSMQAFEWSETMNKIMLQYKVNVQEHCFNLVAGGYTSIKLPFMANILGMNESETISAVQKRGWTYLQETQMIKPLKTKKEASYGINNEEHLERLTQHILFLET